MATYGNLGKWQRRNMETVQMRMTELERLLLDSWAYFGWGNLWQNFGNLWQCMATYGNLGVVRRWHLPRHLLQEVEPPPDGKVEEGEHDERQKAGQTHLGWGIFYLFTSAWMYYLPKSRLNRRGCSCGWDVTKSDELSCKEYIWIVLKFNFCNCWWRARKLNDSDLVRNIYFVLFS